MSAQRCHAAAAQLLRWAIRPLAAGEPLPLIKAVGSIGAGCPSAGGQRAVGAARSRLRWQPFQVRAASETRPGGQSRIPRKCSPIPKLCTLSALRSTAAPDCKVGAGTGFARAAGVVTLGYQEYTNTVPSERVVPFSLRPNPSIERTHNGGAQCLAPSRVVPPLCAAHVKR